MNSEDIKIGRKLNIFQYCRKLKSRGKDPDYWFQAFAQDAKEAVLS